jgi:hypothetical protein
MADAKNEKKLRQRVTIWVWKWLGQPSQTKVLFLQE